MMNETVKEHSEETRTATEKVVKDSDNISADVRDITIEALSKHHLNLEHIKSVIKAVLEGAENALKNRPDNMHSVFKEVVEGLDEALEKSAHASKLAIEETVGRLKTFNQQDLKKAMDDLSDLEEILIESLSEVANNSKAAANDILQDLVRHMKNSGTAVGRSTADELIHLSKQMEKAGEENIAAMGEATMSFAEDISRAASGVLSGMADSIKNTKRKS